MKLFQIEEPDGSPTDPDLPGAAVGIDVSGLAASVAVAVGGNALVLADREGFELDLAVPPPAAPQAQWQKLFEGARLRAERALARPVTHAVIVAADAAERTAAYLQAAAIAAGLIVLRVVPPDAAANEDGPAAGAALLAEDLAPRFETP